MSPDLPNLRARAGIPADDTSQDAQLTAAWSMAIALANRYTDRTLEHGAYKESFTHIVAGTIQLKAYPELSIVKVTPAIKYHANIERGTLYSDGTVSEHEITIDYSGGYTVFPDDLMLAILNIFDVVYLNMTSAGGASVDGAIKSIKAGDMSIQFDAGSGAAVNAGGGLGGAIPPIAEGILDTYIRYQA